MMRRVAFVITAVALSLLAAGLGVRLVQVHREEGTWSLTTPGVAHRIHVFDRDYDRSGRSRDPVDDLVEGATVPGGTVLVPPDLGRRLPLVIEVRDDEGRVWTYGLVGGP
ncbi:hypothetical protein KDN32_11110 [Nocardioides sp. J2M5]|uniref:hypothetical protein n=1 Tax=Nocardioides palaemonis TaxID=2829810 RepID=UPI001BA76FF6|nr:hypothetical protein [Nocardioides palaemonis]MBS2938291.1 hypothetical protein [Nocardioides palaemonis]